MEQVISSKLYRLALWYIRKCHSEDRNYRKEVENLEYVTYKNCSKAHLIYGLGAEWENFGRYEVIDNAIQRLWEYENKLAEQPQADKWIPCEERLPEPIRPVLVTVKNWMNDKLFVRMGRFHTNHWEIEGNVVSNSKIIAWQPLPQPYKKEGAENDGLAKL